MSFFSFDRSGSGNSNFWNYSQKDKANYSTVLQGILVELSDPCATKFGSNVIDRWDDGNPKRNIRMTIMDANGTEWNWDFAPGGKEHPSMAMVAAAAAFTNAGINADGLESMLGMTIRVSTEEPPGNFTYSRQNPRPWAIQILDTYVNENRGVVHKRDWEKEGGKVDAAPPAPAQMGSGQQQPTQLQQTMERAKQAVMQNTANTRMNVPQQAYVDGQSEIPPASVYDQDIPF